MLFLLYLVNNIVWLYHTHQLIKYQYKYFLDGDFEPVKPIWACSQRTAVSRRCVLVGYWSHQSSMDHQSLLLWTPYRITEALLWEASKHLNVRITVSTHLHVQWHYADTHLHIVVCVCFLTVKRTLMALSVSRGYRMLDHFFPKSESSCTVKKSMWSYLFWMLD